MIRKNLGRSLQEIYNRPLPETTVQSKAAYFRGWRKSGEILQPCFNQINVNIKTETNKMQINNRNRNEDLQQDQHLDDQLCLKSFNLRFLTTSATLGGRQVQKNIRLRTSWEKCGSFSSWKKETVPPIKSASSLTHRKSLRIAHGWTQHMHPSRLQIGL